MWCNSLPLWMYRSANSCDTYRYACIIHRRNGVQHTCIPVYILVSTTNSYYHTLVPWLFTELIVQLTLFLFLAMCSPSMYVLGTWCLPVWYLVPLVVATSWKWSRIINQLFFSATDVVVNVALLGVRQLSTNCSCFDLARNHGGDNVIVVERHIASAAFLFQLFRNEYQSYVFVSFTTCQRHGFSI